MQVSRNQRINRVESGGEGIINMRALLIQARLSSERFPGKMLAPIVCRVPLVEYVYRRSRTSKQADVVAVITSTDKTDDALFSYCRDHDIKIFRGALNNVLDRYIKAAEFFKADVVCRVCGDSPFVDTGLIDKMFEIQAHEGIDYVAPERRTCIAGLTSEVVTVPALGRAAKDASLEESEHVTLFLKNNRDKFKMKFLNAGMKPEVSGLTSLTVDYPGDLKICGKIAESLGMRYDFEAKDILSLLSKEN